MEIYQSKVLVNFRLNPKNYSLNDILRDVSNIGHWGCGDLQIIIKSQKEIELTKKLLQEAYEEN